MDTYYVDGRFMDAEKAVLSANDITVLRGYGIFDFLITYNRRPFYLEDHVRRFQNSARCIGLEIKHGKDEICEIVEETLGRNSHHTESAIRIVNTGGVSSDGVSPEGNGLLMVMVTPKYILPPWWYTDGVKIITSDMERVIPASKSTCYLSAVCALREAKRQGAVESVYVDRHGRILEGTTTNFFCVKRGRLVTPDRDILPGITRRVVMGLAENLCEVETRDIDRSELPEMDEVFITASNKEVVPVVLVNGLQIRDGRVGPLTAELMKRFREYTTAYGLRKAERDYRLVIPDFD
ncbi:MAG: aminotransferase class IV [Desulfobacteraceae bacterium]|nr:aminotransferase class IV [Desulfobacteraceae bacterium]